jgi:ATP-dependent Clp protease ATP-binding subunit ClpC
VHAGGTDTFERFTERARQVVVLAQDEARALGHNYIGTEHLLLGLVREEEGLAARVLDSFGVTLEEVRTQVERICGRGEVVPTGQIPFTPRAKKTLELSLREALSMRHNYIGTEHLLLGLTDDAEGVAMQILAGFDASPDALHGAVLQLLGGRPLGQGEWELSTATLTGASDTWAAQLDAWEREGWELVRVHVERRRKRPG